MKTSKLMRAALPLIAVVGLTALSPKAEARTFAGTHIFKYVEMTTDLTPGYTRDSIRADIVTDRPFAASDAVVSDPFIWQERVNTKRDASHIRSVTDFRVYEGPLTHSFLEISSGIAISASDRTKYETTLDRDEFISRYGVAPGAQHLFRTTSNFARRGHKKANNDWEGQIIVGYDLSKTREGNKAATFEPFAGYFWIHTKTSRQEILGDFLGNEPAGFVFIPARAFAQSQLFWHGFVLGLQSNVTWFNWTVGLRGQANFCRARSHEITTGMDGETPQRFRIMDEVITRIPPDRDIATWRYLGYTGSIVIKRHIPLTNWTFFTETKFTHMRDKRYSDRVFNLDVNGNIGSANRIEKLWHRRVQGHAGFSLSY